MERSQIYLSVRINFLVTPNILVLSEKSTNTWKIRKYWAKSESYTSIIDAGVWLFCSLYKNDSGKEYMNSRINIE